MDHVVEQSTNEALRVLYNHQKAGGDKVPDRFNYVKKGYNPDEVDQYIEKMESVIASYKEKDNAIKNAIVSAQLAADNMIKNAENQVVDIRRDASQQLESISKSISRQRKMVQAFQNEYNLLIQKYITDFNDEELNAVYAKIDALDEFVKKVRDREDEE